MPAVQDSRHFMNRFVLYMYGGRTLMKELPLFTVNGGYGYNQELFTDCWMNRGGCGAVVACDVSIYLARCFDLTGLYPFAADTIGEAEYVRFSQIMKPYLHPRMTGIDTTQIWIDGYRQYLAACSVTSLRLAGVQGDTPFVEFAAAVTAQIDKAMPMPYLNLRHRSKNLADYVWHWFWLAGYERVAGTVMVKAVSYGSYRWLSLYELWDTGFSRKGGIVCFDI